MSLHSMESQVTPITPLQRIGKDQSVSDQQPPSSQPEDFHAKSIEACLTLLETTLQGLTDEEASTRQQKMLNDKKNTDLKHPIACAFLHPIQKTVSLLFVAASLLSFCMGHPVDGILILVALFFNTGLQGLIQIKFLKHKTAGNETQNIRCSVRRNGTAQTLFSQDLAVGDILLIAEGQVIPADARLISSYQIQVDESPLTGESVLVPKNAGNVLHPLEEVTAQSNMLFAGTVVKTGKGEAMVTVLQTETVMGKISSLAQHTTKQQSLFSKRLHCLSMQIFMSVVVLIAIVVGIGLYQKQNPLTLAQNSLVMAIAAFPETIGGIATLILSLGVRRLADKKVLVKSLQALETIGDIQIICTDKTGTLTENYLIFDQLYLPEIGMMAYDPQWQTGKDFPCQSIEAFLRIGRLNNGTLAEGLRSPLMGDPIDVAIYRATPASLETGYHQRANIPFDPVNLRSAVLCDAPDGTMVSFIKGAPESVMEICKYYMKPDGSVSEISLMQRSEFLNSNRKLAFENNYRLIGFAQKQLQTDDQSGPYSEAVFIGWVCLLDPPKAGVLETIADLRGMGNRLIMITGDQKATAEITARELGIIQRQSDEVWLRSDLEAWEEPAIPTTVKVFARTRPEEKLAIVSSLQKDGQVVAMIGDGVNDSPALQKSDVAIAMGLQGSEAAKDSADIILLNDRLEGIVDAIQESRSLRIKAQSCLRYLLSCNIALILFVAVASISGLGIPVHVIQILWLNLVIVAIPALVLAIEPERPVAESSEIAQQKIAENEKWHYQAHKETQAVQTNLDPLDSQHLSMMLLWSALIMLAGIGAYLFCAMLLKQSPAVSGTAAFCTLALAQTFHLFNVQAINATLNRGHFMAELASTPITWIVVALALGLQTLTVYLPGVSLFMGTQPMPLAVACVPPAFGLGFLWTSLKLVR